MLTLMPINRMSICKAWNAHPRVLRSKLLLSVSLIGLTSVSTPAAAQSCGQVGSQDALVFTRPTNRTASTVVNCGPNINQGPAFFAVNNAFTLNVLENTTLTGNGSGGSFSGSAAVPILNQLTEDGLNSSSVKINVSPTAKIEGIGANAGIDVSLIQVLGNSNGIGAIQITNAGVASSEKSAAISATTNRSDITIFNSGLLNSTNSANPTNIGIRTNSQSGNIYVSNSGIVSGLNAIQVNTGSGSITVENAAGGLISSLTAGAPAITGGTGNGRVQIINAGAIIGDISINNAREASINNSGTFSSIVGGNFGGGTFQNSGTVSLVASASGAPVISSFRSLSTFTNSGTIDLRSGTANNRLTINGNYVGDGGKLVLQASTQNNTSDRLIISGNASGKTGISVNNLTPNTPFTTSPTLVQVGGTIAPGAFTLTSAQNFGTLQPVLMIGANAVTLGAATSTTITDDTNTTTEVTGTTSDGSVRIAAVPTALGLSGPTAVIAARTIAQQGGNAIIDRVTQLRDSKQAGSIAAQPLQYASGRQYAALISKDPIAHRALQPMAPLDTSVRVATWARATGDLERRTGSSTFGFGGAAFSRDLGYTQRTGAILGGADAIFSGLTSTDDGLIVGLMGGYTIATVSLNGAAGRQDYSGGTIGTYATYLRGPLFIDALFKADVLGLDITSPGFRQGANLQNYSYATNVGYRFPLEQAVYLEPTAGLDYVATDFGRSSTLTGSTVPLRDGDALRGRVGLRVGSEAIVNKVRIEPSVTGYVYTVLSESNLSGAFNGITSITGLRDQGKARGELQAALNIFDLSSGVSGFVRADMRVGNDLLAGGGRVGARYQW